jgi:WD40 repeat protein
MRYTAFISYSHESDSAFARAFQSGLEQLAKPWNRRRALDIFRDETDLSISPELLETIFEVLDQSSHFLLLASPRAASSKWVQQEVEHWVSARGSRSLLIILTGGELVWDDQNHDFDWDRTDALPQCLRGHFAGEPLWVDFRWAKQEPNLTLKHETFRDAVATVAAELHGMSKRDLVGEDLRQHRNFLLAKRIVTVGGAVLLTGVLLASYLALQQSRRAEQRRTIELARRLASDSVKVVDDQASQIELSVLLAAESVRRQSLFQGDAAIRRALALYPKAVPYEAAGSIRAIAFSADSHLAALASDDDRIEVIELPSGKARPPLQPPTIVVSLALSREGNLAAAGDDGIIRLFDVSSGKKIGELKVDKGVVAMNFSPDERELAAGEGRYVRMFHTEDWKPLPRIDSSSDVRQLAFRPDGQLAVAWSKDVVVYAKKNDAWTQTEVDVLPSGSAGDATALSADGRYWASCGHMASQNKNCAISNVSNGLEFTRLVHPELVQSVVFSPDSRYVATSSRDQVVRVFETATGSAVMYLPEKASGSILFSPDSRYIVTGMGEHVRLYQLSSETVVRSLPEGRLVSAAFSADGRYVAHGGSAEVFDLATSEPVLPTGLGLNGRTVALSVDGRFLAIGDPTRVLEVNGGTQRYGYYSRMCMGLAFSSDARYLAVGMQGSVQLHDVVGHKLGFERRTGPLRSVSLSGDGKYLAAGIDGAALLFSLPEDKEPLSVKHKGLVHSVAISADGRYLASGGVDDQVPVYDVVHRKELYRLSHQQTVYALAFSPDRPDGRYIATGGLDKTARIFNLATGEEIARLFHEATVLAIAFSADGRSVMTAAGKDSQTREDSNRVMAGPLERPFIVMRHLLRPDDLREEACARLTRNLTHEEWTRYIGDEPYRKTCPKLP